MGLFKFAKYIKGPTYSETLAKAVRDTMEKIFSINNLKQTF